MNGRRPTSFVLPHLLVLGLMTLGSVQSSSQGIASRSNQLKRFRLSRKALAAAVAQYSCSDRPVREVNVTGNEIRLRGMVGLGRNGGNGHEEDGSFSIRFGDIKKTFAWGPGHGDCPKGSNAWLKGCTALIETKSHSPAQFVTVCFSAREGMDQFVNNLESLVLHAPEFTGPNPAARDEFNRKAAAWRAAAVKPILPENARQHKVLAENAIQEKDFEQAIDEYEAALDAFPTWPEGQFNVALLCGEMGDYEEAIEHMQNYLMLVPEAQDAPAARDKMLVWEHKITAR